MTLFLFVFFLLYGGMHLYVFLKAKAAFAFSTLTGIYLAFFMVIMILAPVIIRLSERAGFGYFARLMSYIGYTWLGVLFLFFSVSVVIDLYRFFVYSGGFILKKDFSNITVSVRFAFFVPFSLSLIIALYGYFEAINIRTETITVKSPRISKEIGRLKIVQISDVHLGLIVRGEMLKKIIEKVKTANPDILVSTGDLVDGEINNLTGLAEMLKEIHRDSESMQ